VPPIGTGKASPPPAREAPLRAARPRRGRPGWLWWLAAAGVGAIWWFSLRTAAQGEPTIQGDRVPYEGNTHVPMNSSIEYRAHPPASGNHYPQPAAAGVYPEGLLPGFWVHSLEHGYIVLAYRPPASPELLRQFDEMLVSFPRSRKWHLVKLVVVPYKDMNHPYAVLAWTWRLWLDQFDREKVLQFYRAHVDRGPEDIP